MSGSERVAVVGTGRMGAAMAGRLAAAGHPVVLWNRTAAKARAVADETGADVAESPAAAAAGCSVVVVSLADDAAVRAAYEGPHGLLAGLGPGQVVADTSTVAPGTLRALAPRAAGRGATLLDTPVSGSVSSVESGTLLVMAGGSADAVEQARPVLGAFCRQLVHVGELGAGSTMKLAVNAMVFGLNGTLAEALVLAERAGIARELAYEVIAGSAVAAPFVHYKRAAYEQPGSVPVAFSLELAAKDLDLATALADQVGASVPQLRENRRVVGEAIAAGLGQDDLSALAAFLRHGRD